MSGDSPVIDVKILDKLIEIFKKNTIIMILSPMFSQKHFQKACLLKLLKEKLYQKI